MADRGSRILGCGRSVVAGLWHPYAYINGGGMNLEWFRETFARDQSFDELNRLIAEIEPGSDGLIFIPHLEGRAYPNDPEMRGQWKGFTRAHGLAHFYRAVLEGVGYEYALYMERILQNLGEERITELRGVAGGSKSAVWAQMKADILGCSYHTIDRDDVSILGQALIAAAAVGAVEDIGEAAARITSVERTYEPNQKNHRIYGPWVQRYREMLQRDR